MQYLLQDLTRLPMNERLEIIETILCSLSELGCKAQVQSLIHVHFASVIAEAELKIAPVPAH